MGLTASSTGQEGHELPTEPHALGSIEASSSASSPAPRCLGPGIEETVEVEQPPKSSPTTSLIIDSGRRSSKLSAQTRKVSRGSLNAAKVEASSRGTQRIGTKKQVVPVTWSRRDLITRIFAVVRHGERADVLGSQKDGKPWTLTEESMRFPIDPPLSDVGRSEVVRVAAMVKEFADRSDSSLQIVVSSLYFRCVQTAVEICKKLGPGTKLMLDHALGEVYGPCVLGDIKPMTACHPFRYLARYAHSQGVKMIKKPCGHAPEWPESLRKARERYATAFLTYMRRADLSKRNFVIVSHADCIASILALVPGKAGRMVESVSYAATVLGSLCQAKRRSPDGDSQELTNSFDSTEPGSCVDRSPSDRWQWEVAIDGIRMGPRWQQGAAASRAAKRAIANIDADVKRGSRVDLSFLEELLGGLSEEPLGDVTPQSMSDTSAFSEEGKKPAPADDSMSSCSSSTYLYGASDEEPDCGSPDYNASFESSVSLSSEVRAGSVLSPGASASPPRKEPASSVLARSRGATESSAPQDAGSSSEGAGKVMLQGCGSSAIMARRAQRGGAG